jgi:hypothetical protein
MLLTIAGIPRVRVGSFPSGQVRGASRIKGRLACLKVINILRLWAGRKQMKLRIVVRAVIGLERQLRGEGLDIDRGVIGSYDEYPAD